MLSTIIRGIITGVTFSIGSRIVDSAIQKYKEKKEEIQKNKDREPATVLDFRPKKEKSEK
jgi:hypothetical protein